MARRRRKLSPHFKAETAQFVVETRLPLTEIAHKLEINEGTRREVGS